MPGIYIHIPFCKQACNYCNFHFSTSLKQKEALIDALIKEINGDTPEVEMKKNIARQNNEIISTLYFGGGTPSLLNADDLKLIVEALQKRFVFAADAEITLEANPDDITDAKLQLWKTLGINRLSVGIQSFVEEELLWMNRAHTAEESLQCIDKIQAAGFTNFSVDLIYGSPLLSNDYWKRNVQTVFEKAIPHISCYALTVEPKTALNKMIAMNKKAPVDAERQAEQFLLLMEWMNAAGYEHYEISNFAKPGFRSRHNSSYWSGEHYYGFGPSAHSFDGTSRRWNIANNALYIQSLQKNIIPYEEEVLNPIQQLNEYIMTALRTMEGMSIKYISTKFGEEISHKIIAASAKYKNTSKLRIEDEHIILTDEGKLFADGIAADLFF